MGETKFLKIKRIIDEQKVRKVRGEAMISQLTDEKTRIFNNLKNELGRPIDDISEVIQIRDEYLKSAEEDIDKIAAILAEEGYDL